MDPIARAAFWDLIAELARTGHTVFVTTHYMDEAEYCNRLALMYAGKVIALGDPAGLKRLLKEHGLLRLDTLAPLDAMRAIEHEEGILEVAVFGSGLHVVVDDAEAPWSAFARRSRRGTSPSGAWSRSSPRSKTCSWP